jgi:putative membrane protein
MRHRILFAAVLIALSGCDGAVEGGASPEVAEANGAANGVPPQVAGGPGPATASNGSQFVELAAAAHMFEIESARLASERARHPGVRALAESIIAASRNSAGALETAAGAADPPLPYAPSLSAYQLNSIEALRNAPPAAFDRAFLGQQLDAQQRLLTLLTDYAITGDVAPLRRHASEVADPVRQNLSRTRDLVVEIPFE